MRSRSENVKLAIIDTAGKLFMQNGYSSTSIDSIAESVGVTRKTIYNYFNNKSAILESVIDSAVCGGHESSGYVDINTIDDLNRELLLLIQSINDILLSHKYIEFLRMSISEVKFQPDVRFMVKRGATAKFFGRAREVLSIAADKKIINVKNLDFSARMFIGGFLVSLLIDGLLDPSHINIYILSQAEAMEYVGVFLANHTEKIIGNIQ